MTKQNQTISSTGGKIVKTATGLIHYSGKAYSGKAVEAKQKPSKQ